MQTEALLKAGESCYFKDFTVGKNRWGDYSATVVDPTDDTKLWTIQEYAATPSGGYDRWGTWWGMLDPTRTLSIGDVTAERGRLRRHRLLLRRHPLRAHRGDGHRGVVDPGPDGHHRGRGLRGGGEHVLTFNPGETAKQVDVTVNGDTTYEVDETFHVNLANPTGADILDGVGVGTIVNDDPFPGISIGDLAIAEGNERDAPPSSSP